MRESKELEERHIPAGPERVEIRTQGRPGLGSHGLGC